MPITTISHTAWLVTLCQIILSNDKRWQSLIDGEDVAFYRACYDYCHKHALLYRVLGLIPEASHLTLIDNALAKGAPQHYVLRKQAIKKQVKECLQNGVGQLVVIGGGFDPLALHTARRNPGVQCFEIDMPAMHGHKVSAAKAYYGALPGNFHAIEADLSRTTLQAALSAHGFDGQKPTLFVAEGVTMYLNADAVVEMFQNTRELCKKFIGFFFTAAEPYTGNESGWGVQLRRLTLLLSGEKFSWNVMRGEVAAFLRQQGFAQQYLLSYSDLQRPWRSPEEMAVINRQNGEYLVYAVANTA